MFTLIRGGLNLRLFDGETAGNGDAGQIDTAKAELVIPEVKRPGPKNPLADVKYGVQLEDDKGDQSVEAETTDASPDSEVDREAQFEELIKGKFKDLYNSRVEGLINDRFKHVKALESQLKAHSKIAEVLAIKYELDPKDVKALAKAVESDDSLFESLADQMGLPDAETARAVQEAKRYRAEAMRAEEELARRAELDEKLLRWRQDAEIVKQQYFPNMDFDYELRNPETGRMFASLLHSGVPVYNAYIAIHGDQVIGGAMQHAAQVIQQKTTNDIRARGMRPVENGASGQAAASVKSSVKNLTRADHEEINRRIARGETIKFG